MKTEFDPKLKEAMREIEAIIKKYDCMASVIVVSPTHIEYKHVIEASWSVAKFEEPGVIRFKAKQHDFPSKEACHQAIEATVHGFSSFQQYGRKAEQVFGWVIERLGKEMTIIYETWK